MKRTEHYDLPTWEENDRILMDDFNDMTGKIDEALGIIPQIAAGTYTGDGTASRTIDLGRTPRILYVCSNNSTTYSSAPTDTYYMGGLVTADAPAVSEEGNYLAIVENGFQVAYASYPQGGNRTVHHRSNTAGQTYRYLAIF